MKFKQPGTFITSSLRYFLVKLFRWVEKLPTISIYIKNSLVQDFPNCFFKLSLLKKFKRLLTPPTRLQHLRSFYLQFICNWRKSSASFINFTKNYQKLLYPPLFSLLKIIALNLNRPRGQFAPIWETLVEFNFNIVKRAWF